MKKLIKIIYLIFTAFLFACNNLNEIGKGESEWVNKQTTVIAKNGGSIEAENKLTNTGAVIASLNTDEKLKISANKIEVNNLQNIYKFYS